MTDRAATRYRRFQARLTSPIRISSVGTGITYFLILYLTCNIILTNYILRNLEGLFPFQGFQASALWGVQSRSLFVLILLHPSTPVTLQDGDGRWSGLDLGRS